MLSKIILGLISISILISLIFFTYIINTFTIYEKPYYKNTELWLFKINTNEEKLFSTEKIENNTNSNNILIEKINISDQIIFSDWNIESSIKWNYTIIDVWLWIYLFNLKEINTNYIVKWKWFEINNLWPWSFFINNLDPDKIIVFSINSLIELQLKNINTDEEITNIDLYPHTYLIFNPKNNIYAKNSDLLKISQIFSLWYFKDSIILNNVISEKIVNLISLNKDQNNKIVNESLLFLKQDIEKSEKLIKNFSEYDFLSIPWESYINKYVSFFVNNNKKSIYYKNIIIRDLSKLLENKNNGYNIINNIINNYENLKKIDKVWAEEIKQIIYFYYSSIIKTNKNFKIKILFSELQLRINKWNLHIDLKSLVNLEKIFFTYDFQKNNNFYNQINLFIQEYLLDLKVQLSINNNWIIDISNIEKTDYLLFFLEKVLLTSNFSSLNIDNHNLLKIYNIYAEISNSFYINSNNKTIKTWIFINSKILQKFDTIIKNKYFKEDRNINSLLEIKNNLFIDNNEVITLEKNITMILNLYKKNIDLIDIEKNIKDKLIHRLYTNLEIKYKEYFTALKNYKSYIIEYDEGKKILLNENSINDNKNIIKLSKENLLNYLKQFSWVNFENINITLMDYNYCLNPNNENELINNWIAYCYKIENLNVNSNNVSFLLYPFNRNEIKYITLEGISKSWAYKLDDVKIFLDDESKSSSSKEEKYEFKDYLINIFSNKNTDIVNNEEETITDKIIIDDPIVKVFKRNKLLWENWDFININNFITINYNNLIVVREDNDNYSIKVKDSPFKIKYTQNQSFLWILNSEYNFNPKHSFINPTIKLINDKSKLESLMWNSINIIWEYKVNNIENEIINFFKYYNSINYIINDSSQILKESKIKITYFKDSDIVNIEIPYMWSTIFMQIQGENITKITLNNKRIIISSINYRKITEIFNNINK